MCWIRHHSVPELQFCSLLNTTDAHLAAGGDHRRTLLEIQMWNHCNYMLSSLVIRVRFRCTFGIVVKTTSSHNRVPGPAPLSAFTAGSTSCKCRPKEAVVMVPVTGFLPPNGRSGLNSWLRSSACPRVYYVHFRGMNQWVEAFFFLAAPVFSSI